MTQPSSKVFNEGSPRQTNSSDVADPNNTIQRIADGVIHQSSPDVFSISAAFSSGPRRRPADDTWRSKCKIGEDLQEPFLDR